MKRKIKFRAWDKDEKMMFPHEEIDKYDQDGIVMWGDIFSGESDFFEPMQFTGLLDKNSNEIYEGDIVICTHPNNPYISRGEVKFVDGAYWVNNTYLTDYDGFEIIGNICENSDLLIK